MRMIAVLSSMMWMVASAETVRMATEQYAAVKATNVANYVVAPVALVATQALAVASNALFRPVGVSTAFVESAVAPVAVLATNAYNTATGKQDRVDWQSLPGLRIPYGGLNIAGGSYDGYLTIGGRQGTPGYLSFAMGDMVTASGNYSIAFGVYASASGSGSFASGSCSASGAGSFAIGSSGQAIHNCSFVFGGASSRYTGSYESHGEYTVNLDVDGPGGLYLGHIPLSLYLDSKASTNDLLLLQPELQMYDTNASAFVSAYFEMQYTNGVNRLFIKTR